MPYNKKMITWLVRIILINCIISALAVVFLATRDDTTLLGDPYYEDTISVPQRALVPWLTTMLTIPLTLSLAWLIRTKNKSN